MAANHRRALRARVRLLAYLASGDEARIPCTVVDLSPEGAAIELPPGLQVPRVIRLALGEGRSLQPARVLRQRASLIGIEFLEARNVPEVMPD